ncbi:hypothetical protein DRQ07_10185 [candidate division KSB1 bacterium]|nr:MAG: hypothetical protein DRQ07_10185 [candidate division KSB1 bacterium]
MKNKKANVSEFSFKECDIDDYDIIINIWDKAGLRYKPKGRDSKEKIEEEMQRGVGTFFIVYINNTPAGCILATHDGRKGWINRLAVLPEFRRMRIASALVRHAEKHLEKLGMEIITCLIEGWNETSMKLFSSLGYTKHEDVFYFSKRKNKDV